MATQTGNVKTSQELQDEIKRLEGLLQEKTDRLQEAQDTLEAIRSGAVDGLVRNTAQGDQVFLLKGSDEPYRNLIEQMTEGALLVSETGTILFCNHGFARLVDAQLERIMGSSIQDWLSTSSSFHLEVFSKNTQIDQRLFEVTFKTTKQQLIPTQLSLNKISLDSIHASALIVTDLTKHMEADVKRYTAHLEQEVAARKKAEDALKDAQAKLQEYAKDLERLVEERTRKLKDAERLAAIGQVAGMVGHDIRNPLQAIVGELYFAKESMKDLPTVPKEALESLDFIQEQTDYISKIVADLQDYAKPLKPDFTAVELCEFISNAVKTIPIPDNIETAFICEKEIPQIKLDKTFTTRILTNLINNAIQAMPKGGKLTLKAITHDKSAVITVEDTGVGIPEEVKAKMFTPLFTTKSKGQGFGLAVVKRLVEAQGGTIGFESEAGKGTKFTVTLPLTR
jgi:PAS domain S-box-containing protein